MKTLIGFLALSCAIATGISVGCAAGNNNSTSGNGGSGGGTSSSTSGGGSFTTSSSGGGNGGGGPACAKFTAEASQAPAAMLIVLDMSASMNKAQKWGSSQLAVVSAVDKDVFDSMSLGLVTFPASFSDPPQCLCDSICAPLGGCDIATCKMFLGNGVSCGVSFLPQVPIAPAGKEKSNAQTGVRSSIYEYLTSHQPLSNSDDGSPVYDALSAAYTTLKLTNIDRRIVLLITDGGFSCTSVASPARPGYQDLNNCPDWEQPGSVNQLISEAHNDPNKPINTFVVGVPGSNSTGAKLDGFDTPPYKMRLALSTYAVSGSPDTVDPACDKGAVFSQNGAEPAVPCHIDLSAGGFDADKLATAISNIRGKALGCVYDLPAPPMGEMIDLNFVNVVLTIDNVQTTLPKRSSQSDQCMDAPCWDYNAKNQIEIIGKGCADLGAAQSAKVEIQVGCETILK